MCSFIHLNPSLDSDKSKGIITKNLYEVGRRLSEDKTRFFQNISELLILVKINKIYFEAYNILVSFDIKINNFIFKEILTGIMLKVS